MIEFGNTLRQAREAKGYTVSQIAEMTHMMTTVVSDLENERFSKIAAPIYGRGFVKLYCEAVGIDPKPLIDQFMVLYNGNGDRNAVAPSIVAPSRPTPEPLPADEPAISEPAIKNTQESLVQEPITEIPPSQPVSFATQQTSEHDLFSQDTDSAPSTATQAQEANAPIISKPNIYADALASVQSEEPRPTISRYSRPMPNKITRMNKFPNISINPMIWRIGALAIIAILIIWGLIAGIRALYKATTDSVDNAPTAVETFEKTTAKQKEQRPNVPQPPAMKVKSNREPQSIPQLYID